MCRRGSAGSAFYWPAAVGLMIMSLMSPVARASDDVQATADAHLAEPTSPCGDCGAGQCVVVRLYCDSDNDNAWSAAEDLPSGTGVLVELNGGGQYDAGDFFCTTAPTLTIRARKGSITGPWQNRTTGPYLDVEIARKTTNFQCGGVDAPGGSDIDNMMVQVNGDGDFPDGTLLYYPINTNVTHRMHRGPIYGPWINANFPGTNDCGLWNLDVARPTVNFQCGGVDVANGTDIDNMQVEVNGDGNMNDGGQRYYPIGANVVHRMHRGPIYGPWLTKNFVSGECSNWNLDVAGATVNFQCAGMDVTDADLANMRVEVNGDAQLADGDGPRYYPIAANVVHRMRRFGIAGPWLTKNFVSGECGTWHLPVTRREVNMECNGTTSTDGSLRTEVNGDGPLTQGTLHVYPINTNITWRVTRGGIAQPWQTSMFSSTDCGIWDVHVANVRMSLRLGGVEVGPADSARVEINGLGLTKNGDTFSLPLGTCIVHRRKRTTHTDPWSTCPNKTFVENECGDWIFHFDDLDP